MFSVEQFSLSSTEKKILITFILIVSLFPVWMYTNSNSRLDLTKSVVNEQSLDISKYSNNTIDKVKHENRTYTDKAPGSSFFAAPMYAGFKIVEGSLPSLYEVNTAYINQQNVSSNLEGKPDAFFAVDVKLETILLRFLIIFTTSIIPAAATLLLIYRTLVFNDISVEISTFTTMIVGFGTVLLDYSTVFMANTLAMFLGFFSFYILEVKDASSGRNIAVSGVLAGLAALVEYYMLIIIFLLATYLLTKEIDDLGNWKNLIDQKNFKSPLIYLSGSLAGFSPYFVYNYLTVGNPLTPVKIYGEWLPKFSAEMAKSTSEFVAPIRGFIISPSTPEMVVRVLFGIGRGFFIYSPILLLAIPGLYYLYRENRKKAGFIISIFLAFVLFNATYVTWYGGAVFGSRYLLAVIPFLSLPLGYTLDSLWDRKHFKKILIVLAFTSIFVSILALTPTGLHPTEKLDVDADYSDEFSSAYEDLTGMEPYFNPLPEYTEQLLKEGPRSPWIEMAAGSPDKNLNYFSNTDEQIVEFTIKDKIILLGGEQLELVLIMIIVLILWRKEIFNKMALSRKQRVLLISLFGAIMLLSAVSVDDSFKGSGWYVGGENTFVSGTAHYKISKERGYLKFDLRPYKEKNLTITNGNNSYNFKLEEEKVVRVPVEDGINKLKLEFNDCQRPVKHSNSTDIRCISAEVNQIEFNSREDIPSK